MLTGFFGRLSIAIEPVLCGLVFTAITVGVFLAPRLSPKTVAPDIIVIAPVFALGMVACAVWALGVMFAPVRALFQTIRPIYIVDGYLRYRGPDAQSAGNSNGYVAVLTDDRSVACEWPTLGRGRLHDFTRPALCEFSEYGGVHTVDGRSTGVVPDAIPALGVSIMPRRTEIV